MTARLNVNIDHVATVRQVRRAPEAECFAAAMACEHAGVTASRSIVAATAATSRSRYPLLRDSVSTYLIWMAATDEMLDIALQTQPTLSRSLRNDRMRSRPKWTRR